jgi:anti-anti-sigma factor
VIRERIREDKAAVGRRLIDVPGYTFRAFVTNRNETAVELWREYNGRATIAPDRANSPWRDGEFALNPRPPRGLMWRKTTQAMEIEKKISGDSLELMLSNRIDGPVANNLEVEILAAIKQGYKAIYVNLAQATFLCSAGIRVLLQYHRQMKGRGLTLLVSRPSPEVASALEMTGFPELVEK